MLLLSVHQATHLWMTAGDLPARTARATVGDSAALVMGNRGKGDGGQGTGAHGKGNGRQIAALERATVGKSPVRAARATAGNLPRWRWASTTRLL
jgi:hypothetical protein